MFRMKIIVKKKVKVAKGKHGKYGVIKLELKLLRPYIGKELQTTIREAKK